MTTGSWNRDSFTTVYGGWVGRKWSRSWSGTDYGQPVPYNKSERKVQMRFGLGSGHADEIFSAIEESDRASNELMYRLEKDGKRAAYAKAKHDVEVRKQARLKEAYERAIHRAETLIARKKAHQVEKEWRKIHKVPFPKELLKGPPPKDYIPRSSVAFSKPARVNPKPPKRKLVEDHPYTVTDTYLEDENVTWVRNYRPYPYGTWPNTQTYPVMAGFSVASWYGPLLGSNDQIKLVNKLQEKLQGSDFNLAVFLAEGNQTLELIGDVATRTAKALHRVTRGDFFGTARALFGGRPQPPLHRPAKGLWGSASSDLNVLSARILEFQYGIKPLFSDAYDASVFLAHQLNAPYVKTYRVGVRQELVAEKVSTASFEVNYPPWYRDEPKFAHAKSVRTHSRHLIARIAESDIPTLPYALGLMDPEVIIWEKIPFSFVYDWFQPIGPYLEARAAVSRLRGTFVTSEKIMGEAHVPTSAYFTTSLGLKGHRKVVFTRSISSTLAVTMPTVKPLSKAASFQHCLNGLALLTSFATGFSRIR